MTMARLHLVLATAAAHASSRDAPSELRQRLLSRYGDPTDRPGEAARRLSHESCLAAAPPDDVEVQLFVEFYEPIDTEKQTWGFTAYVRARRRLRPPLRRQRQ